MRMQMRAALLAALVGVAGAAGLTAVRPAQAQTGDPSSSVIVGPGTADGQLNQPAGVAVDAAGNVYVADTYNHRVQKFDRDGAPLDVWGGRGVDPGTFDYPQGIAIGGDGLVYVADTDNHRIQKFSRDGDLLGVLGAQGPNPGQLSRPRGVAADASGTVYVLDTGNGRVQKFDRGGALLAKWGTTGTGATQFNGPSGIALDRAGNVLVADTSNNQVKTFSPAGALLGVIGFTGDGPGQFLEPRGVFVDADGNIWVADSGNDRIQELSSDGRFLQTWGSHGEAVGQFSRPSSVAVDPSGAISVADTHNSRVQRLSKKAPPAKDTTAPTTTASVAPRPNQAGWSDRPVTVTLAATDPAGGSGVKEIVYTLNGAATTVPGASAEIAVSAEGISNVTYFARDNAGSQEAVQALPKLQIDTTPPVVRPGNRVPAPNANGWNHSDVTVSWTCEDRFSGSVSPGTSTTVTTEGANQSATGTCTDNAGHSASDTQSGVSIDKTPPTVTADFGPSTSATGWSSTDVTVTLAADDRLSGVARIELNLDDAGWVSYSTPVVVKAEGRHRLAFRATDKADNVSAIETRLVQIDRTGPTLSGAPTSSPNGHGWYNADVAIAWTCADNQGGSGIDGACPAASTIATDGAGRTATASVKDRAGNQATATSPAVNVDKAKPTVTYSNHPATYSLDQRVQITCTPADQPGLSGLASSTCQNVDAPAFTFGVGTHTVSATATDKAGNVGSGSTSFTVSPAAASFDELVDQMFGNSPDARAAARRLTPHVGERSFESKALKETAPRGAAPTKKQPLTYEQGQALIRLHESIYGF